MLTTGHTAPLPTGGQGPAQTVDKLDTGGLFVQLCINKAMSVPPIVLKNVSHLLGLEVKD